MPASCYILQPQNKNKSQVNAIITVVEKILIQLKQKIITAGIYNNSMPSSLYGCSIGSPGSNSVTIILISRTSQILIG
jgi:hypothetical protein